MSETATKTDAPMNDEDRIALVAQAIQTGAYGPEAVKKFLRALVAEVRADATLKEREACAEVAEQEKTHFASKEYSVDQPLGSLSERVACDAVAHAIRSRAQEGAK